MYLLQYGIDDDEQMEKYFYTKSSAETFLASIKDKISVHILYEIVHTGIYN